MEDPKEEKITFSNNVQNAIQEVLPCNDLLDNINFNSIDYINQLFPNEQSLSNIDEVILGIECNINVVDNDIHEVILGHVSSGNGGPAALEECQNIVRDIFTEISGIRKKAEKTDNMVKKITKNIKILDHAKKNLTTAITTINHIHMIVGGVETLKKLTENRSYREILNPLQAIIEVHRHFEQYNDISKIKDLSKNVQEMQQKLTEQIRKDFLSFFGPISHLEQHKTDKMMPGALYDACKILSVLNPKIKEELLAWFIDLQLEEYIQLFNDNQDIAWLDKVDKRFSWFKHNLILTEDKYGSYFPPDWQISERMAIQFCNITKQSLSSVLQKRRNEIDSKTLLYALSKTQAFEALLNKRFYDGSEHIVEGKNAKAPSFDDTIASCLKEYLDIYLSSIDKNLHELINRFVQNNDQPVNNIYPSSADLFLFYKKSIVQCTQLNSESTLRGLGNLFKKYLREYAKQILERNVQKCPINASNIGTSVSMLTKDIHQLSSAAGQVLHNFLKEGETQKLKPADIITICCVLTTSDYCLETVTQLETKLNEKIHLEQNKGINFSEEMDIFHRIISNCIQLLVQHLDYGCEPALSIMSKIQWQQIKNVGDQSSYINLITEHLSWTIPLVRDHLATSRKYYTQLCHKFVSVFIPKYINTLYKCRLMNTSLEGVNNILGCEQLLLDTHTLKTLLLNLPSISSQVKRKAPASFTKVVINGMSRAEIIIKLVMTSTTTSVSFVEQVVKLLPDVTAGEYQKILDMKGVKKGDQLQYLNLFRNVNPNTELESDLSSITNMIQKDISNTSLDNLDGQNDGGKVKKLENLIKKHLPS